MRKLMLVGELNNTLVSMAELLSEDFWVQLAPDDAAMANRMRKIFLPDLVIWNGYKGSMSTDVEDMIRDTLKMGRPPVLGMCVTDTKESMDRLKAEFPGFDYIPKPSTKSALIETCKERLGMVSKKPTVPEDMKVTILVVDDNALEIRRISRILNDSYRIITASNGREAVEKALDENPKLILLDYEMPEMNGKETLEMLNQFDSIKNVPVIFLTGVNDKEKIVKALDLNPYGYILKPPVPELLLKTISEALGGNTEG